MMVTIDTLVLFLPQLLPFKRSLGKVSWYVSGLSSLNHPQWHQPPSWKVVEDAFPSSHMALSENWVPEHSYIIHYIYIYKSYIYIIKCINIYIYWYVYIYIYIYMYVYINYNDYIMYIYVCYIYTYVVNGGSSSITCPKGLQTLWPMACSKGQLALLAAPLARQKLAPAGQAAELELWVVHIGHTWLCSAVSNFWSNLHLFSW